MDINLTDAPVTITLCFANVTISLWAMYSNPVYFERFAEWPYQVVHKHRYYQMVTSAFLHANFMHLFFNMFALFTFGFSLEAFFIELYGGLEGSLYFFLIYVISLLVGSVLPVLIHRNDPTYVAVGASGAVSGIVFSYIIFDPTSTIYVLFLPMPAYLFAILWIGFSIYGMKTRLGNIGHEAHLGGAFGGVIATFLLIQGSFQLFLSYFTG
ncbi:MAG TPA: rhomboid family intramembrane serine protease [Ignavibacteria bacterium]|nr:rhomboid family intramembrane serine protease [Ignavibacteria bacterium]